MESQLESRCIDYLVELSRLYGSSTPSSLTALLEHFEIADVRERPLDCDARLVRQFGRLIIEVSSLQPRARQPLSIAHELGHLIVDRCSATPNGYWGKDEPTIESLCDRLANTILRSDWDPAWLSSESHG
jgi:hypothetical protein